ncbi:YuiB family protein [Aquibacillus sp. 3ASR75-11]|uniref:YuiB family protein n=1 Tax=Terrihalobacillus insolitus TaxID=2950438 RepID=A0A9X3WRG7_9BACI|nr:YuiB family protein [Terrihalobacillus insolitus]MDC3412376.1 YuiB family protein [Terrihalobacillus insolitus]MDC3422931.1 YuiB family protein [Terrihalobacillus insolitus]
MLQLIVSMLLFFVLFFGIAFILNMLLRQTWIMSFIYPIIVLMIVDELPTSTYFTEPARAFSTAWGELLQATTVDIVILITGFIGTIVSGIVMKMLRARGYQMF